MFHLHSHHSSPRQNLFSDKVLKVTSADPVSLNTFLMTLCPVKDLEFSQKETFTPENAKYHCLDCYLDTKKMKISHWMEITTPQRAPHARLLEIGLSSLCSSVPRTADLVAVLLPLDTIFTTFKNYLWITSFCRKFSSRITNKIKITHDSPFSSIYR